MDFLLTGESPTPEQVKAEGINPFYALIFCTANPHDHECRLGTGEVWFQAWERIKETPLVIKWRKKHGKSYAEHLLEDQE